MVNAFSPGGDFTAAIVELDRVGARDRRGREILQEITVQVTAGSAQFLTGPSGAGKSTLLRLMSLIVRPSRGRIRVFGTEGSAATGARLTEIRRRIGWVFDDLRLLGHLNAYDNVALPLEVRGREEASFRTEVNEALAWAGLRPPYDAPVDVLPAGERQLVGIARAIVTGPSLILADEPTSWLDAAQTRRFLHMMDELRRQGVAMVMATQNLHLLEQSDMPRLVLTEGRLFRDV